MEHVIILTPVAAGERAVRGRGRSVADQAVRLRPVLWRAPVHHHAAPPVARRLRGVHGAGGGQRLQRAAAPEGQRGPRVGAQLRQEVRRDTD